MSDMTRMLCQGEPHGGLRGTVVSATCLLRQVPRFFCAVPRTPLRVLCIAALDTLHVLRCSHRLPRHRIVELATFLDFQACTNAVWDRKPLHTAEYRAMRQRLEKAGCGSWIEAYLVRLRELETRRPSIGGDRRRFDDVRSYREAVARLSLAAVAAIALEAESLDEAIRWTHGDGDVQMLFRLAMQCQIIDDVVDYTEDLAAGLPSFLTASASLPRAMELTAGAARGYGGSRERSSDDGVLPLRLALWGVTALANLVVRAARWHYAVAMYPNDHPNDLLIEWKADDGVSRVRAKR